MELKMNEYQLPEKISFNFDELKQELTAKVSMYESMVYTDDQLKEAKADKANLNKLKKALNDERIKREKEYMIPFNEFKSQVNEIISIIDKPVVVIDKQVKAYEEKQKEDKRIKIESYIADCELNYSNDLQGIRIPFNDKWLNASVSFKSIEEDISSTIDKIKSDLITLSNLPEFGFESTEVYKSTLDINKALNEGHRMAEIARAKAEAEAKKAEYEATQAAKLAEQVADAEFAKAMNPPVCENQVPEVVHPVKNWVKFAAYLTVDQARELKKFFDDHAIDYKAI